MCLMQIIYDVLMREVNTPYTSHDFGKDILPKSLEEEVICTSV